MNLNILKRRGTAIAATLVSAGLVLSACGGDDNDNAASDSSSDSAANSTSASSSSSDAAFPVTVIGAYGDVTVEEKPENIVVVSSYRSVDSLAALGEKPVFGYSSSGGEEDFLKASPWMEGLYSEFDATMIDADWKPDPEAVSLADPDLIILDSVDEDIYDKLSEIAPTYAPKDINSVTWQQNITTLGTLVGKEDKAEDVIAETEAQLADTREQLSNLQGATYNEFLVGGDSTVSLFPPEDGQLLHILGMENTGTKQDDFKKVSFENISELNADVFIERGGQYSTEEDRQKLEGHPGYGELPAVKNDAVLVVDTDIANAIGAVRPAALEWVLPKIMPQLKKITVGAE
ncbi:hypothetical protein BJF89_05380 [Corynebacterium sp. CNJ-954]|uniref:ABC transporter substrate-binding protein n=1 Tax=Corynebacterium sp. CNJ-954 TaxID=1904962 RepID=UPI0009601122|nr:ABC transporter substrate-binding protein [Corynebacterium sp. CNJ-954]OLT51890.1 hypothetical protein BJF89_05380 [Corynebacterium sp. CNJ-954]